MVFGGLLYLAMLATLLTVVHMIGDHYFLISVSILLGGHATLYAALQSVASLGICFTGCNLLKVTAQMHKASRSVL